MTSNLNYPPNNRSEALTIPEHDPTTIETSLSQYHRLLYFVAHRVLGNHWDAQAAVQSCLLSVSHNAPSFEREGSLRGWLVRVLIDEALVILRKNRIRPSRRAEVALKPFAFGSAD